MSKYELTFRRTKGSPVTSDEIDQNFRNIKIGHDDHEKRVSSLEQINLDFATDEELLFQVNRIDLKINSLTTDDITEGVNFYYTDNRVAEYLSTHKYATQDWVNQQDFGSNIGSVDGTDAFDARFNSSFADKSTTDLKEGVNLYYTDTRVEEYLTANNYTQEEWVNQQITALTGTVTELTTTDGITEGSTNLYYTDERSRSAISVDGDLSYDSTTGVLSYVGPTDFYTQSEVDSLITDRIAEVAAGNISLEGYATETYADAVLVDSKAYTDIRETEITTAYTSAIANAVAEKDNTDEITEGTNNLYFTDSRSRLAISVSGDLSYDSTTGVISYSEDLTNYYTKSEAEARISERITEVASGNITLTGYATESYADATIDSKTTDDLTEGTTNLYYTDDRVISVLGDNNIPNEDWVIATISSSVSGGLFSAVATSGNYQDLLNKPANVSDFTNDSNFISLSEISASGDVSYDSTTGVISFTQDKSYGSLIGAPTNVSHFTNDSQYLVDSDIRDEITSITNRLGTLEVIDYTIFDIFKNMYDSTPYTIPDALIEFRIRAIDNIRFVFLASGQSDPSWDTMVAAIYNNDIVTFQNAYDSISGFEKEAIQIPYISIINSDVLCINAAFGKSYDTLTMNEFTNPTLRSQWEQRNQQMFVDAQTFNAALPADNTIRDILINNSYADFTRDTVVSGWNPS